MSRMLALLPLLSGCYQDWSPPPIPVLEPLAPLAEPYIGMFAHTAPGDLRETCEMEIEIFEVGSDVSAGYAQMMVNGGEWGGIPLTVGVQYMLEAEWADCTTLDATGRGTFASKTPFSAGLGVFPVFLYNGTTAIFGVVYQRDDYVGGAALVTFTERATSADVLELAEQVGVNAEIVDIEGKTYEITWDDTRAVAEVLTLFADDNTYYDGEPIWNDEPNWW